jgi:hypothetical protein
LFQKNQITTSNVTKIFFSKTWICTWMKNHRSKRNYSTITGIVLQNPHIV